MPRQARIVCPGYLHHVTQRGNNKKNVFLEDKDRIVYLKYIQKYSQRWNTEILSYCLMGNHVHFIVVPREKNSLAKTFSNAHQRYAQYFHKKNGLSGHLWQGRFFSCLLHGSHAVNAVRYVLRNPVRAGLIDDPLQYRWSSAEEHLGRKKYTVISLGQLNKYLNFSSWDDFFTGKEKDSDIKVIRKATLRNGAVGPKEFLLKLEKSLGVKILPLKKGPRPKGRKKKSFDI